LTPEVLAVPGAGRTADIGDRDGIAGVDAEQVVRIGRVLIEDTQGVSGVGMRGAGVWQRMVVADYCVQGGAQIGTALALGRIVVAWGQLSL